MKSIRTRILSLSLICVIVSNIIITMIGVAAMTWTVNSDAEKLLRQISKEKALEINTQLLAVEQSVQTMQGYILELIAKDPEFWLDDTLTDEHLARVYELANISIRNTQGARSVYYHLSADIGEPQTGIYIIETVTGNYMDHSITDVSQYEHDDTPNVGWYYQPIEAGKAIWMQPYENTGISRRIISYVTPIIYNDQVIGVIGMDVDLSLLKDMVRSVEVYDSGYAFLLEPGGDIVYHKTYPNGIQQEKFPKQFADVNNAILRAQSSEKISTYRWDGGKKKIVFCRLRNDMSLGITLPNAELRKPAVIFVILSVIAFIATIALTYLLSNRVSSVILQPLRDLTDVAKKLESGDLDVKIYCSTGDEVEVLAKSFQRTANELKKYITEVNTFARTDSLTGAWNKAAYEEQVRQLENEIKEGKARFSVAVLDVNNLKKMNDTYGHEAGDLWITSSASAMMRAFGKSRVYRTGGDEFTIIFEPNARKRFECMQDEFYQEMERFNHRPNKEFEENLMVAIGLADYDSATDTGYADVCRRADTQMYVNKKYLKGLLI